MKKIITIAIISVLIIVLGFIAYKYFDNSKRTKELSKELDRMEIRK